MDKKNLKLEFISILLFLLTLSLLCGSLFIGSVSANFFPAPVPDHTIEITINGEVTGTDKIQRNGNVYTFTEDIIGSIVIFSNGIVVDGAGHTLQGNGCRTGVWFQEITGVTIKNLHIKNFTYGIEFTFGLSMTGCKDMTISENTITDNKHGISFGMGSSSNYVLDNTIMNNTYGLILRHSPNNILQNNRFTNNKYNFWVYCETSVQMTHFMNDIDDSNTVNGKPIIYWVNEQATTVPSDAGYVALVNCTDIIVQNLFLTNNSQGILLIATHNSEITKNYVANNDYGIMLFAPYEQCISNRITENNITSNTKDGIHSWNSENTIVNENGITNNQENGINFFDSRGAVITDNLITGNIGSDIKIWGHDSRDNYVANNNNTQVNIIPEFPSWIILPLLMVALLAAMFYRRKMAKLT